MKLHPYRRCCQCTQRFVPDPRVGHRQVTCGVEQCQRERHAERCRIWHSVNTETSASHYADVIVPFRGRQPDYQRRWRLGRRWREIREKTKSVGGLLLTSLRALLAPAEALQSSATRQAQTGVLAGKLLDEAVAVLRTAVTALEQLEASVATLHSLGL